MVRRVELTCCQGLGIRDPVFGFTLNLKTQISELGFGVWSLGFGQRTKHLGRDVSVRSDATSHALVFFVRSREE